MTPVDYSQAMGENLLSVLPEFSRVLAEAGRNGALPRDEKAIYFDVLGYFMVRGRPCIGALVCKGWRHVWCSCPAADNESRCLWAQVAYSPRVAKVLHSLPVAFVLSTPLLASRPSTPASGPGFTAVVRGAALALCSVVAATLSPALLATLRVLLGGRPPARLSARSRCFLMSSLNLERMVMGCYLLP